jgi:hypothetical protein
MSRFLSRRSLTSSTTPHANKQPHDVVPDGSQRDGNSSTRFTTIAQPTTDVACFAFSFLFILSIKDELLFKLHEDEVPQKGFTGRD